MRYVYTQSMKLWLRKETFPEGNDIEIRLEDPEDDENWWSFATQEEHYLEFVDMLERMAQDAMERDDLPEHDRCLELAGRFMQQIPQTKLVM